MKITQAELRALIGLLKLTEAEELTCEEFLSLSPGYLEELRVVDAPLVEGYESFLQHLKLCPECRDEFEALCQAVRDGLL